MLKYVQYKSVACIYQLHFKADLEFLVVVFLIFAHINILLYWSTHLFTRLNDCTRKTKVHIYRKKKEDRRYSYFIEVSFQINVYLIIKPAV